MSSLEAPPRSKPRLAAVRASEQSDMLSDEWIERAIAVCEHAAQGNFELRILHIDGRTPPGRLAIAINDLLDRADAFVREAGATLAHAAEDKFYRRVLPNGMVGAYRRAADIINGATEAMASKSRALADHERRRQKLAQELDEHVGAVVEGLATSAATLRTTAQQLTKLAQDPGAGSRSASARSSRVLPAPDGPSMTRHSPFATSKVIGGSWPAWRLSTRSTTKKPRSPGHALKIEA